MLYVIHNREHAASKAPDRRGRKRLQTLERRARTAAALFETHGYDTVTMEQIAAAGDVAKGTLYNHFHAFGNVARPVGARPGFAEGALYLLNHSANWCATHPHYLAPYLRFRLLGIGTERSPSSDVERLSDIADTFAWRVRCGQTSGEIRAGLDPARLTIAFHHVYLTAMLRWLAGPRLKLRREFAAAAELFLHGADVPANGSPKTSPEPRKKAP